MAEPARQLVPDGFDPEEIEEPVDEPQPDLDLVEQPEPDVYDIRPVIEKRQQQEAAQNQQPQTPSEAPPAQPTSENPELTARKQQKAQSEAERVKSGEQRLKKATNGTPEAAGSGTGKGSAANIAGAAMAGGNKEDRKERAKDAIKEQAKQEAKQYAKQIARQLAAQLKRAAVQFISKNPYAWAIIGIILLIIIIVVVIFVLFSFDGQGGKGPAQYPETALQQQQANFLLAISGDQIASDTAVKEVIDSELERYDRIIASANRFDPDLSAGAAAKKTEFDSKLTGILIEKAPERRKALRDQIRTEMQAFEATLPFGSWIAQLAEERVGQPNLQFCTITQKFGATATTACASFTSTVLYLAGVPNPIVPSVDEIWKNSALQIIVARPASASAGYYQANVGKLQRGDIIFWGDGACSPRGSKDFDHVGFYVGGDEAIDTSSSQEKVLKRPADKRDSCRVFNGARRYGR